MKGLFIPGIKTEMFKNGCLESIEALMAEGEIYDIDYPLKQEPKAGHWIVEGSEFNINVKCSCCNYIANYFWSDWNKANYCPNCGAKMGEPQEESEGAHE